MKTYEKWCFQKANALFFISPEDKNFAITKWNIDKDKCIDLPFGIDIDSYPADREICREQICRKHNISNEENILLFTGLLSYKSNLDALINILDKINPVLLEQDSFRYKIIICGKGLPENLNSLSSYTDKNVIYAGFVSDVETYCKAANLFLNPVQSGGGVKTKMVEAIANGTTAISTVTGAAGIEKSICGEKLVIVPDNNWNYFSESIIAISNKQEATPQTFYNHYFWGNIIKNIMIAAHD